MAPEPSTVVPQAKEVSARKEVVVPPKETAVTVVPKPPTPAVVTVLPKQVRIPIVPSTVQPSVATADIPSEPQAMDVATTALISAAATKPTTQPLQLLGTPTSYVTTSPVQSPGIPQTIFPPTPIAPPVITIAGPDVLLLSTLQ
jgi:hypothetical protein